MQLGLSDRVYGPLIELIGCDVEYITAVEVGAQVTPPPPAPLRPPVRATCSANTNVRDAAEVRTVGMLSEQYAAAALCMCATGVDACHKADTAALTERS